MKTTYFNKIKNDSDISNCVSIALYKPTWWSRKIQEAPELMPGKQMLRSGYTYEEYVELLEKRRLKPQKIYKKYKDCVLVCHEKDPRKCHRKMIVQWLQEHLDMDDEFEEIE